MTPDDRCLNCRRYPATRLVGQSTSHSSNRYFCSVRCAALWAVGELDRIAENEPILEASRAANLERRKAAT